MNDKNADDGSASAAARTSSRAIAPDASLAATSRDPELVTVAAELAGWLFQRLPGGNFAGEQLAHLRVELRNRLLKELAEHAPLAESLAGSASRRADDGPRAGALPAQLQALLQQSQQLRAPAEAEAAYFAVVLRQLVPDEALILSTLADGMAYPVIDVLAAPKLSVFVRPIMESISNVGKQAGVQAPGLTPCYVHHLHDMRLLEILPGEEGSTEQYELLEAQSEVRDTIAVARDRGYRIHVLRRSLRRSAVGARLWAACGMRQR